MADGWPGARSCGQCGRPVADDADFCARCGAVQHRRDAAPRRPDLDAVREAWRAGVIGGPFGPRIPDSGKDRNLLGWFGRGRFAQLLVQTATGCRLIAYSIEPDGMKGVDPGVSLDETQLRAVATNRTGVFFLEGDRLHGLVRDGEAWAQADDLIPDTVRPVGLWSDGTRIHCLTVSEDRLILYSGRGRPRLAIDAAGSRGRTPGDAGATLIGGGDGRRSLAWGGGLRVAVDHLEGRLSVVEDADAETPTLWTDRIGQPPHRGGLPPDVGELLIVTLAGGGWGALDVRTGVLRPAPADLKDAALATPIGNLGVLATDHGPVFAGSASVGRAPSWPAGATAVAATGLDDAALVVWTERGGGAFARLLRVGHGDVLTDLAQVELSTAALGRPNLIAVGSLPPLALDDGMLIALSDGRDLAVWRAPWAKASEG